MNLLKLWKNLLQLNKKTGGPDDREGETEAYERAANRNESI
jgi:hypothetical protein